MTAIIVALLFVLTLAALTFGVVVVGIEGRWRDRVPKVADTMAKAGRHLNGEGQPPRVLTRLLH